LNFRSYLCLNILKDSHSAHDMLNVPTCIVTRTTSSKDHVLYTAQYFGRDSFSLVKLIQATQTHNIFIRETTSISKGFGYAVRLVSHFHDIVVIDAWWQLKHHFFFSRTFQFRLGHSISLRQPNYFAIFYVVVGICVVLEDCRVGRDYLERVFREDV
jgi:hypothetical protein